ncbi:P22 phage major capsid protein family protein [Amaricoccus solimangrovi]|uniref:Uncharacterized protein n=1 Tax=Amaricoccus solimangrovi TaxID=2589815 RepID=A0A501WTL3_9RHOB|nr:P22 phage major capsid protein family protein [Amaricoccus solimangrovi]TPE53073.1 hypothetical protein FJM51_03350 [Amaricoccus solimangrovi]
MPNLNGNNNILLTDDVIAKEALRLLKNELVGLQLVNRSKERYFDKKLGDTISVEKPYRAKSASGRVLVKQPMVDQTVAMKVDRQQHFGLEFTVNDRTLAIQEFSERYLKSGIVQIAHTVDLSIYQELAKSTFFTNGTPGNGTTYNEIIDARAFQTLTGHPDDGMTNIVLNTLDAAAHRKALTQVSADTLVTKAIERAYLGQVANYKLFETAQIPTHTVGTASGSPVTNGAGQTGASLATDGWTNSITGILKAGDVITIDGVYSINPQTYQSTGQLQQFVVTADVNSGASTGPATIPISPAINDGTLTDVDAEGNTVSLAAYQNVSAAPGDGATITVVGTGGSTYRQNFLIHKDAVSVAIVDLALPQSAPVKQRVRDEESGLSLAMTAQYDITNYREVYRIDVLWGVKNLYPELTRRILGASS